MSVLLFVTVAAVLVPLLPVSLLVMLIYLRVVYVINGAIVLPLIVSILVIGLHPSSVSIVFKAEEFQALAHTRWGS